MICRGGGRGEKVKVIDKSVVLRGSIRLGNAVCGVDSSHQNNNHVSGAMTKHLSGEIIQYGDGGR